MADHLTISMDILKDLRKITDYDKISQPEAIIATNIVLAGVMKDLIDSLNSLSAILGPKLDNLTAQIERANDFNDCFPRPRGFKVRR